jgi:peptide/nickel transport system substrate-binding protein
MQFRILGPLEVEDEGTPLEVAGAKQRALLALFLLRPNRVVSRDTLIDGLWGEKPPREAEHSLEAQVFRLRKLLHRNGQDLVLTRPGGYVLHVRDGELDLDQFECFADEGQTALRAGDAKKAAQLLRQALSLWRGQALEDVRLDSFVTGEIRGIEDRRLAAYEDLIEAELECGRTAEVIPELEQLVRLNPLRERLQAQLMLALYRSGRQADALAAYRNTRRRFANELGIEPGPELRQLEQAILRQDPALLLEATAFHIAEAGRTAERPARPRRSFLDRRRTALVVALATGAISAAAVAAIVAIGHGSTAAAQVSPNGVAALSPSGHKVGELPEAGGVSPSALAVCKGAIWVAYADSNTVTAVDSATNTVQRIAVGHKPSGIGCGANLVWVANYLDGTVTRINQRTYQVVGDPIPVGGGPAAIAYGGGFVWVVDSNDSTISRIDPQTGRSEPVQVGPDPEGIAVTPGAVWVASRSNGELWRISPRSGRLEAAPIRVGAGPVALAAGAGAVWVANELDDTVSRVDLSTNTPLPVRARHDPSSIAVTPDGRSVWVGNGVDNTISRIDASDGTVKRTIAIGSSPTAVAVAADGTVYVATRGGGASHRGGVLRYLLPPGVVAGEDFRSRLSGLTAAVDPAVSGTGFTTLMYDGVVGYRRVGGPEGNEVVADLATRVPTPTGGGRTYLFKLRRGVRYSNGRLVGPEDLRYGMERVFKVRSPGAVYYEDVVGAHACLSHSGRCNLSKGIVTNDSAYTVMYRLARPDPDFLDKLALPGAAAVPVGTPNRDLWPHPPPGTGPYRIVVRKHAFVLTRNRYFHVWSPEAKPDGYVNAMVFREPASLTASLSAVERNEADFSEAGWGIASVKPRVATRLETQFSERARFNPFSATVFLVANTQLTPFNDVRVRKALSYALDRERMVRLAGGPLAARVTCQILPPGFQSYRPYCPYTRHPDAAGNWAAPNLREARRLIAASRTSGTRITVWAGPVLGFDKVARYITNVLDGLGYKARLKLAADYLNPGSPVVKRPGVQLTIVAWIPDYRAASNFFGWGWCNWGFGWFCDPKIGRLMETAASSPDQTVATARWTTIDRRIVDLAPVIPLYNLSALDVLSNRVGNYQFSPILRVLLEQMWVR